MTKTVAIGGLGAIGLKLARALDAGVDGLRLIAVAARDQAKAEANLRGFRSPPRIVTLGGLAEADIVVEAAPAAVFEQIASAAIEAGRIFVPASVGALLPRMHLVRRAHETGARIVVPTGALLGLDAVAAAAEGTVHSVRMITRKPPRGLQGAPHLVKNAISVEGLNTAKLVFAGSAREAALGFPENVNVVAALSLAGIGPDRTTIEIWADPGVTRNCHSIEVDADSARFSLAIENVPSENPKTGRITALSAIAALRKLNAPLRVGT
jgi:aspartate dehydrogenase